MERSLFPRGRSEERQPLAEPCHHPDPQVVLAGPCLLAEFRCSYLLVACRVTKAAFQPK